MCHFFKKTTNSKKSKYASTIVLSESFYFANKLVLSSTRYSHKNSLTVASCIFGKLEIRALTPNRFKNQTNDTLELLHNQPSARVC